VDALVIFKLKLQREMANVPVWQGSVISSGDFLTTGPRREGVFLDFSTGD
jgi:hypothetical protein